MKEVWKHINGYEDYMVSNLGRVKSLKYEKEKILRPGNNGDGYLFVTLYKNTKKKHYLVHLLVAQAFIPNPDNLPIINHKNEIKTDNSVSNLEWCTYQYNNTYNNKHVKIGRKISKKVGCFKDGNLIKVYSAIIDVENDGFNHGNVVSCCKGKFTQHHGYQWTYIN